MPVDHESSGTQRLTAVEDIFRVLKSLEIYRSFITITAPNIKGVASSLVLSTDLQNQRFEIDQLNDELLQTHVNPGQRLIFRAAYGGIQVSGEARVIALHAAEDGPSIALTFPEKVLHRQRRAAFRANVTANPVTIDLANANRATIQGEITDVSAEGLGVVFHKFVHPPIEPGEFFDQVSFQVDDQDWQINLTAKHPNYDRLNDKYRCGFSFYKLTPAQEKAVNLWVLQLQRRQRLNHRLGNPRA